MLKDIEKIEVLNKLVDYYGYQNWWEDDNRVSDWVYMILIQQTTEKNAETAVKNLESYMTMEQLVSLDIEKLQQFIRPSGFYRQKSYAIKALMQWFQTRGGDLNIFKEYETQRLRKELLALRGIGPETADAMLLYIFERNVFICDQYAMRLFTRLGCGPYKKYQTMQKDFCHLVDNIPLKLCKEWHAVIDVHGKHVNANIALDERYLLTPKNKEKEKKEW